jgi:hypothetical protein
VIEDRDLRNVDEIAQQANEAPAPDSHAYELRVRLLTILANATSAIASATPSPAAGPRRPPPLDQKFSQDLQQWDADYGEWMKEAVQKYSTITSK